MEDEKIWDPDAPLMKKFMQKYPDDALKKSSIVRCKMRDGTFLWTELLSFAKTSTDGKLLRLVSVLHDVDKEWIAARSIEQKNIELNHIIDSTSGGVATYRMDNGFKLISMSDSMAKRLGYTSAELNADYMEALNQTKVKDGML